MTPLTPETLPDYLASTGWVGPGEPLRIERLAGGVSCAIFRVHAADRRFVLKQALEKLLVKVEWLSNPSRIFAEIDCLGWVARRIEADRVPRVLGRDDSRFLFIMEAAPDDAETWKQEMLRGEVDPEFAEAVGDFLGVVHESSSGDASVADRFRDKSRFEELRLDAYLRHTSKFHPQLAERFEEEIERLSEAKICLVHGDYSPKNMLILDGGFWVLDWEVAHYGDPVFDAAFCLNHLLIKSLFLPGRREAFFEAARAFWAAYRGRSSLVTFPRLAGLTGMLMLARVDGKSPVEYVRTDDLRARLRTTARRLIEQPAEGMEALIERVKH